MTMIAKIDFVNTPPVFSVTSYDLMLWVNEERAKEGKRNLRHNVFLGRIKEEFEGEKLGYKKIVAQSGSSAMARSQEIEVSVLDETQAKIMAMRESKGTRRNVLTLIDNLVNENKILLAGHEEIMKLEGNEEAKEISQFTLKTRAYLKEGYGKFSGAVTSAFVKNRMENHKPITNAHWVPTHFCLDVCKIVTGGTSLSDFKKAHDGMNPRDYYTKTDNAPKLMEILQIEALISAWSMEGLLREAIQTRLEDMYGIKLRK